MQTGTATMENSLVTPQKIKNRVIICPSNPSPGHLPEKTKTCIHKDTCTSYVRCNIVHGGQDVWTTKVS